MSGAAQTKDYCKFNLYCRSSKINLPTIEAQQRAIWQSMQEPGQCSAAVSCCEINVRSNDHDTTQVPDPDKPAEICRYETPMGITWPSSSRCRTNNGRVCISMEIMVSEGVCRYHAPTSGPWYDDAEVNSNVLEKVRLFLRDML